jgi:hypothetical protein
MIRARRKRFRKPPPESVIIRMVQLRKNGLSIGVIIERLFDEFHISLSRSGVVSILRRRITG